MSCICCGQVIEEMKSGLLCVLCQDMPKLEELSGDNRFTLRNQAYFTRMIFDRLDIIYHKIREIESGEDCE